MKKIYLITLLLLPFQSNAQDLLIGTWSINLNETLERLKEYPDSNYATLPDNTKKKIINSFNGRQFIFNQDGTVTILWSSDNKENKVFGKWKQDTVTKRLVLVIQNTNHYYDIEKLSATILILKSDNTSGVFKELFFQRVI
jgi:hypothetical protein